MYIWISCNIHVKVYRILSQRLTAPLIKIYKCFTSLLYQQNLRIREYNTRIPHAIYGTNVAHKLIRPVSLNQGVWKETKFLWVHAGANRWTWNILICSAQKREGRECNYSLEFVCKIKVKLRWNMLSLNRDNYVIKYCRRFDKRIDVRFSALVELSNSTRKRKITNQSPREEIIAGKKVSRMVSKDDSSYLRDFFKARIYNWKLQLFKIV